MTAICVSFPRLQEYGIDLEKSSNVPSRSIWPIVTLSCAASKSVGLHRNAVCSTPGPDQFSYVEPVAGELSIVGSTVR